MTTLLIKFSNWHTSYIKLAVKQLFSLIALTARLIFLNCVAR